MYDLLLEHFTENWVGYLVGFAFAGVASAWTWLYARGKHFYEMNELRGALSDGDEEELIGVTCMLNVEQGGIERLLPAVIEGHATLSGFLSNRFLEAEVNKFLENNDAITYVRFEDEKSQAELNRKLRVFVSALFPCGPLLALAGGNPKKVEFVFGLLLTPGQHRNSFHDRCAIRVLITTKEFIRDWNKSASASEKDADVSDGVLENGDETFKDRLHVMQETEHAWSEVRESENTAPALTTTYLWFPNSFFSA